MFTKKLDELTTALEANVCQIHLESDAGNVIYSKNNSNANSGISQEYADYFRHLDFRVPICNNSAADGKAVISNNLYTKQKWLNSEIHNDFSKKWQIENLLGMHMSRTIGGLSIIGFMRSTTDGEFNQTHISRLNKVAPHLKNILKIKQQFSLFQQSYNTLKHSLNQLSFGVIILDTQNVVSYTNRYADTLFDHSGILTEKGLSLMAKNSVENNHLQQILKNNTLATLTLHGNNPLEKPLALYFVPNQDQGFASQMVQQC